MWRGVSPAGTLWSGWKLSSYTLLEHCRKEEFSARSVAALEKLAAHREEKCGIRFVTGGLQSTKYLVQTLDRVHVSAGGHEGIFEGVEVDMKG